MFYSTAKVSFHDSFYMKKLIQEANHRIGVPSGLFQEQIVWWNLIFFEENYRKCVKYFSAKFELMTLVLAFKKIWFV